MAVFCLFAGSLFDKYQEDRFTILAAEAVLFMFILKVYRNILRCKRNGLTANPGCPGGFARFCR
jgi:hypothetical protein